MTTETTTLTCPKCSAPMRTYERSGILIDQCTDCRGIFLDQGELQRLMEAEQAHYGDQASDKRTDDRRRDDSYREPDGSRDDRSGHGGQHGSSSRSGGKRSRGSFLGDLLDFG